MEHIDMKNSPDSKQKVCLYVQLELVLEIEKKRLHNNSDRYVYFLLYNN